MSASEIPPKCAAMAQISIERMLPSEAGQVSDLFTSVVSQLPYYNEAAKTSEINQHSAEALKEFVIRDPQSVLIAKTPRIVGFCVSEYDDGLIWLAWFGVSPLYQRRGIATQLLNTLESSVVERDAHKVWCDCRTNNAASIAILTQRHYQQMCCARNHWYGQDFFLWEKIIG